MKRKVSIQLKAALLLLVFGMNTIVGFACAVGVDMGFNATHHHDEEVKEVVVHTHADGTKHNHHNKVAGHQHVKKDASKKDDCCNDKVVNLIQTDKAVPQSNIIINPVFITAFVATYFNIDLLYSPQASTSIKYFVRCYHPPISDIRITIQSFQI